MDVVSALFETGALKICPEGQPFWYTSGGIGPYYINTHFLIGGEISANELLSLIDDGLTDRPSLPAKVFDFIQKQYLANTTYQAVITLLVKAAREMGEFDFVSGGERRDWFFSPLVADILNLPHLWIFKDLKMQRGEKEVSKISKDARVLHVADLVTEASSYVRAWFPAIEGAGGKISGSLAVVDRLQGGTEIIKGHGVDACSLCAVDKPLFDRALEMGYINTAQYDMAISFMKNPASFMRDFLTQTPEFLKTALTSTDAKTRARAELCLKKMEGLL